MLTKNALVKIEITDLNNLGFGVAKIDGISVFVADTVTGDTAEIRIIKTAKIILTLRIDMAKQHQLFITVSFFKR